MAQHGRKTHYSGKSVYKAHCGMRITRKMLTTFDWGGVDCKVCILHKPGGVLEKQRAARRQGHERLATPADVRKQAIAEHGRIMAEHMAQHPAKPKPRRVERYSWWEWQRLSLDKKEQCIREWAKIPAGYYRGE